MASFASRFSTRAPAFVVFPFLLVAWSLIDSAFGHEPTAASPQSAPFDTQPAPEGVTTAQDALARLRVPPGFQATLFAGDPDVRQPIAMATDHRGRLWVAENYSYAQREVNFDSTLRDRIAIFEDHDRDGHFDKRTIFWDQASKLTSVEIGFGGVWALCPPQLLFIPDRDGDDIPDGPPEVMLEGWDDDAVRHNIANGLRWGPDGWLYGRHGILATSQVGTPGTPPELRTRINCGVWRFHPTRHDFEVVCQGTTNSWGMDWDEHGQLFFINTVIGHLWHVVPGAHFQRMYGEDLQPNLYELIPQTADHFHWDTAEVWSDIRTKGVTPTTDQAGGGHAHSGMMIYQGGKWPRRYHNTVFAVNLHGRRVNNDRLARKGAGYVATHESDFLFTSDPWFRGVEIMSGPEGHAFLADWSDIGECHENDGVHRSSGRIFQIRYGQESAESGATADPQATESRDLSTATDAYLVAAQFRSDEWLVRQTRRLLQERALAGRDMSRVHTELRKQFTASKDDRQRLRALWCLHGTGGAPADWLSDQLSDPSEHVRAWVVQLLSDQPHPSDSVREVLQAQAEKETSGLVLSFLAGALQKLPVEQRLQLAVALADKSEFAADPMLPLLIWYGVEPAVARQPEQALRLAKMAHSPKLPEFVARRLTSEIERDREAVAALVAVLRDAEEARAKALVRGMHAALRGWRKAPPPADWNEVARRLAGSSDEELVRLTRDLSVVFGDGRALDDLKEIARMSTADLESRRAALRTLAESQAEGTMAILQKLLSDRDLQVDAVRGLAAFDDPSTPKLLIERWRGLQPAGQREAVNTLASRAPYARVLLAAIAEQRLSRDAISPFHVRQLLTLGDDAISNSVAKLWPELEQAAAAKVQRIAEYRERFTPATLAAADLSAGRQVYQRVCANCHVLFGQGGKVGPDLTGAQRSNLNYLLENIVDPSATVSENFRMAVVITVDGRVLNGVLAEKTDRTVTVATPTDRIVLALDEIEEIRSSNLSIMPEGQLDLLTPDQARDLIAYLMSPQQVER